MMKKKDRVIGIISLLLGLVVIIAASQIPMPNSSATTGEPGPRVFPYLAGALLILSGIGLILEKQEEYEPFLTKRQWGQLGLLLLVIVLYAFGLHFFGFAIPSVVLLYVTMTMFAGDVKVSIPIKILYSIAITAFIWFIFVQVFKTVLPRGILF